VIFAGYVGAPPVVEIFNYVCALCPILDVVHVLVARFSTELDITTLNKVDQDDPIPRSIVEKPFLAGVKSR
jgi:hypothetical protein